LYGYQGKVLQIDLTHKKTKILRLQPSLLKRFLGGLGVGAKLLYDNLDPKIDAYSPKNPLIFMTGPVAGTLVPTGSRYVAVTKSPLTGIMAQSWAGTRFGCQIKFAGYDGFMITGRAEKPVYLWIEDDTIEFKDATHVWGKLTHETDTLVKEEIGCPDASVACIGPAGENLVRFACVMNDRYSALGRGGIGAVLGSKNLKAIAVYGTQDVSVANMDKFLEIVFEAYDRIKKNPVVGEVFPKYGTLSNVDSVNEAGVFPTRNYQFGQFEEIEKISMDTMISNYLFRNVSCYTCPIACQKRTVIKRGKYSGVITEGPEYESLWAFSANCGVSDVESVIEANHLCNLYGLDTISTGGVIAFTMECFEKGLLTKEELGGQSIRFGNASAMVEAIHCIAYRKDYGNFLAEGVKRVAEKLGVADFAMHVKGQEMPAYDPRGLAGMGLAYATSNRGACHNRAWLVGLELYTDVDRFTTKGKAEMCKSVQDSTAVKDSLIMCHFPFSINNPALDFDWVARMLEALTGFSFTEKSLLTTGERIWNITRAFNVQASVTGNKDTLPKRLLEEPLSKGPSKGCTVKLKKMLKEYYKLRGWDEKGIPTEEKLLELDLASVADDLKGRE